MWHTSGTPAALVLALVAPLLAGACAPEGGSEGSGPDTAAAEDAVPERTIQEVMGEHGNRWMVRPEVTGMGIGRCDGEPCIVVYLAREIAEDADPIPGEVEGYTVRTEVVGRVVPRGGGPEDGD